MDSFRWGTFEEFLEANRFKGEGIDIKRGPANSHLGRIDMTAHGGTGTVEYYYGDSLRVVIFDCTFDESQVFNVTDAGWIRLNFGLHISVGMAFGGKLNVQIAEPSWRFIHLPDEEPVVEVIAPRARLQWVTVCFRPALVQDLTGTLPQELPASFSDDAGRGDSIVHRSFKFTPFLQDATVDLLAGRVNARFRAPYIVAKAQELLVLGLDHMLQPTGPERLPVRLTSRDIEALREIRALVDFDLVNVPTVRSLSLKVGMNRNKLFYGFKRLFGVSFFQYLQDRRIEEGYRLLTATERPVGEIAADVGFRHQCNFATAFKARYGVSPTALRKPP